MKQTIETTVARQILYGKQVYRDIRPTRLLAGRHIASHGKRRISAWNQAQGGQKKNEVMEIE